jgi:hypothetical protein
MPSVPPAWPTSAWSRIAKQTFFLENPADQLISYVPMVGSSLGPPLLLESRLLHIFVSQDRPPAVICLSATQAADQDSQLIYLAPARSAYLVRMPPCCLQPPPDRKGRGGGLQ